MNQIALNTSPSAAPGVQPSFGIDFFNQAAFDQASRVAQLFSQSALVPTIYQGKIGNCILALDIAARTGSSALMVMQNLNIIHGKPSWSSQYIIAAINAKGMFTPLRYEYTDLGPLKNASGGVIAGYKNQSCIAYAWEVTVPADKRTKENRVEGVPVSCQTAVAEGWWFKSGSKWPNMTELMLQYRAATFFGRMYIPESLMGMQTQEEAIEIDVTTVTDDPAGDLLDKKLAGAGAGSEPSAKPPRRQRGASSVEQTLAPAVAELKKAEAAAGTTGEPAATTAAPETAAPAAAESAPPETPVIEPAPEGSVTVRVTVEQVKTANAGDGKVVSAIRLSGEFDGDCFYEQPPTKFPDPGAVIDAVMYKKPHKTQAGRFLDVIHSYTVLGG